MIHRINNRDSAVQKLGFVSEKYNNEWQIEILMNNGIDKAFTTFEELFEYIRSGDEVYFTSLLLLDGSDREKLTMIDLLRKQGAKVKSCIEPQAGDETPTGKLIENILIATGSFVNEIAKYRI